MIRDDKSKIPETGEVFTRPEVVAHMLREVELAGRFRKWGDKHVLEPSCGEGGICRSDHREVDSREATLE